MSSFKFTSTQDMAAQLRVLATRLDAVPDVEIPPTLVELDIQVFGESADTVFALNAVDYLLSTLTNGRAAESIRDGYYHYGMSNINDIESAALGDIPVWVATAQPLDDFNAVVKAFMANFAPVEAA